MTHLSEPTRLLFRKLEAIEASAWGDDWAAAPATVTQALGLRSALHESALLLAADHVDSLLFNRVLGLGVHEAASDATLDAIDHHYAGAQSFALNVPPYAAAGGLETSLRARGFDSFFHHLKWARGPQPPEYPVTSLRAERVTADTAGVFAQLAAQIFADGSPAWIEWLTTAGTRPHRQHFVTWDGGTPVGCGALFVKGDAAWLGMGGTLEAHRGKGSQSLLFATRIAAAIEAGAQWLTTETAPDWPDLDTTSVRNAQRAGFTAIYERPSWIRP